MSSPEPSRSLWGAPVGLLRGGERKACRFMHSGGRQASLHPYTVCPSWTKHHPGEDTGARQTQGPDSGGIVWSCCGFPSGQAEGDTGQNPELALGGLPCFSPVTLLWGRAGNTAGEWCLGTTRGGPCKCEVSRAERR